MDRVGNIGDRAVVPAGGAESVPLFRRNHPVTTFVFPIGAKPVGLTGGGERYPIGAAGLHGAHQALIRKIAKLGDRTVRIWCSRTEAFVGNADREKASPRSPRVA
jgi:hypothetical protein